MARKKKPRVITFTLNEIRATKPCADGWKHLLRSLPEDIDDNKRLTIDYLAWHVRGVWDLQFLMLAGDPALYERLRDGSQTWFEDGQLQQVWSCGYTCPANEVGPIARRVDRLQRTKREIAKYLNALHAELEWEVE